MSYNQKLAYYDTIVAKCNAITRKGKSMPYTSSNGHMFSLLNKDGELGFRYDKETQMKYMKEWNSDFLMSHGAKLKGYVKITDSMFDNLDHLATLLEESHTYVNSLPTK